MYGWGPGTAAPEASKQAGVSIKLSNYCTDQNQNQNQNQSPPLLACLWLESLIERLTNNCAYVCGSAHTSAHDLPASAVRLRFALSARVRRKRGRSALAD